jgi:hypothetical protein
VLIFPRRETGRCPTPPRAMTKPVRRRLCNNLAGENR